MKTINASDIENCPASAEFCKFNPSEEFIELFYKWISVQWSNGTTSQSLVYLSECGSGNHWVGSAEYSKHGDKFVEERLTKIIRDGDTTLQN